jgi:AcrR family transcriptional regulator
MARVTMLCIVLKKSSYKYGRPSGDHAQRQREIANTLLKVIGEHGFEKASMRLVAREANCTTGVLSHYFSSKEDLDCIAVDLLFDWAEQRAIAAAKGRDSLKALLSAAGLVDGGEQPDFDFWAVWLQVLAKATKSRRLAHVVRKRHGQFRLILTKIISDGQERKQIRTDISADLLADHFNAIADGLGLMAPIEVSRFDWKRVVQLADISIAFLRNK